MEDIKISEFKIHPIRLRYAANNDGNVIDLFKKKVVKNTD